MQRQHFSIFDCSTALPAEGRPPQVSFAARCRGPCGGESPPLADLSQTRPPLSQLATPKWGRPPACHWQPGRLPHRWDSRRPARPIDVHIFRAEPALCSAARPSRPVKGPGPKLKPQVLRVVPRQPDFILTFRDLLWASTVLGRVILRMPFLNSAWALFSSTPAGRSIILWKVP